VQHGIVRIDLSHLDPETAAAIREARRPLGRILIDAGMLREVHGVRLLEIVPGPHLQKLFAGLAGPTCRPDRGCKACLRPRGRHPTRRPA
jgi:hypothetical protein